MYRWRRPGRPAVAYHRGDNDQHSYGYDTGDRGVAAVDGAALPVRTSFLEEHRPTSRTSSDDDDQLVCPFRYQD